MRFQLSAPEASEVFLAGDFNSWDASDQPLKKDENGVWQTRLSLDLGKYEYLFVVDGIFQLDTHNTLAVA